MVRRLSAFCFGAAALLLASCGEESPSFCEIKFDGRALRIPAAEVEHCSRDYDQSVVISKSMDINGGIVADQVDSSFKLWLFDRGRPRDGNALLRASDVSYRDLSNLAPAAGNYQIQTLNSSAAPAPVEIWLRRLGPDEIAVVSFLNDSLQRISSRDEHVSIVAETRIVFPTAASEEPLHVVSCRWELGSEPSSLDLGLREPQPYAAMHFGCLLEAEVKGIFVQAIFPNELEEKSKAIFELSRAWVERWIVQD